MELGGAKSDFPMCGGRVEFSSQHSGQIFGDRYQARQAAQATKRGTSLQEQVMHQVQEQLEDAALQSKSVAAAKRQEGEREEEDAG